MAKHHNITPLVIGIVVALGGVQAAHAQMPYINGYNDGYIDRTPLSGRPDYLTEYGRGWHAGQDAADDEDDEEYERMMRPYAPNTNPYPAR